MDINEAKRLWAERPVAGFDEAEAERAIVDAIASSEDRAHTAGYDLSAEGAAAAFRWARERGFGCTVNIGDYEQARARLWRPGQEQHVVYYHLGVEGTVDADVAAALEAKQDLAAAVLSSLKSGK